MIIGLHGCKGVGKDTAAQFLVERHGFVRVGFADKLYEACAALFGITLEEWVGAKAQGFINLNDEHGDITGMTWRAFMQRFGTEVGRELFGNNFWIEQWERTIVDLPSGTNVVVPDVRFRNEALAIDKFGGEVIQIKRPGHEPDGHPSEEPLHPDLIATTVHNADGIDDFRSAFLATFEALKVGIVNES